MLKRERVLVLSSRSSLLSAPYIIFYLTGSLLVNCIFQILSNRNSVITGKSSSLIIDYFSGGDINESDKYLWVSIIRISGFIYRHNLSLTTLLITLTLLTLILTLSYYILYKLTEKIITIVILHLTLLISIFMHFLDSPLVIGSQMLSLSILLLVSLYIFWNKNITELILFIPFISILIYISQPWFYIFLPIFIYTSSLAKNIYLKTFLFSVPVYMLLINPLGVTLFKITLLYFLLHTVVHKLNNSFSVILLTITLLTTLVLSSPQIDYKKSMNSKANSLSESLIKLNEGKTIRLLVSKEVPISLLVSPLYVSLEQKGHHLCIVNRKVNGIPLCEVGSDYFSLVKDSDLPLVSTQYVFPGSAGYVFVKRVEK